MKLNYVIFDGTYAFVVDEQDMLTITADDKDVKVIYKSISVDQAFEMADLFNKYNS